MRRCAAWVCGAALALGLTRLVQALPATELPAMTAAEIVARNAVARGGIDAWRRIDTMAWTGDAENSNVPGRQVPFLLEQKRPGKTRFEVVEPSGMKAVRAYDGANGWKLRPGKEGPPEIVGYAPDELSFARGAQVIEGPLMDYVATGAGVAVAGIDAVEGRRAYVLDVRVPSGGLHRVWVDAQSFLELRHDREFHDAAGHVVVATVRYRDYHAFEGLQIPVAIETGGGRNQPTNRLTIERVALNPPIEDKAFERPETVTRRHGGVVVDTRRADGPAAAGTVPKP